MMIEIKLNEKSEIPNIFINKRNENNMWGTFYLIDDNTTHYVTSSGLGEWVLLKNEKIIKFIGRRRSFYDCPLFTFNKNDIKEILDVETTTPLVPINIFHENHKYYRRYYYIINKKLKSKISIGILPKLKLKLKKIMNKRKFKKLVEFDKKEFGEDLTINEEELFDSV